MVEKQELHCHSCNNYVQFNLDLSIDDNYKLLCPKCGHEHYRVVEGGVITDKRWGRDPSQDDGGWTTVYVASWSSQSYQATSTSTNTFTVDAWANTTGSQWA